MIITSCIAIFLVVLVVLQEGKRSDSVPACREEIEHGPPVRVALQSRPKLIPATGPPVMTDVAGPSVVGPFGTARLRKSRSRRSRGR